MNVKNKTKIINKQIPLCLTCHTIPLFLLLSYISKYDIIFTYKCLCSYYKQVFLSQYYENRFIISKIIETNCTCRKRYKYYCSTCDAYVCGLCLKVHNNHILFSMRTEILVKKCIKHHKIKKYFCQDCYYEICEDCCKSIHKKHKTQTFFTFFEETKRKISIFYYNTETVIQKMIKNFPEEKKKKAYDEINTLFSYYKNIFDYATEIKSFEILISMNIINYL